MNNHADYYFLSLEMDTAIPNDSIFVRPKFGGIKHGEIHFILGSELIKESSPETCPL